jgi:hypothetical protein
MIRKLMVGTALCAALGLPLSPEMASAARLDDPSAPRPACRLADAAHPLKLLRSTVLAESGLPVPAQRTNRRANIISEPSGTNAREQASRAMMVLLERGSKPASLVVGVGY